MPDKLKLVGAVLIVLAGWADAQAFAQVPTGTPGSSGCRASRSYNDNWFVKMTVSNTGSPCTFNTDFINTGGRAAGQHVVYTSGTITSSPQHGTVTIRTAPMESFADYTPAAGYTGVDHFELALSPGSRRWLVDVTVTPAR